MRNETITINKYDEYKDSGIEWIGLIPKHWESKKIKKVVYFEIGGSPSRNNLEYYEGNNVWVSIADLNSKQIILSSKENISDEAIKSSNVKLIPKGSLLYSFKLTVGLNAFAGCNLYTNEAIASFFPSKKINLKYLRYNFYCGFENNSRENIYGAKLFNTDLLKNAKIPFPPLQEQEQIADYLDTKTQQIDKVIQNTQIQIEKLKEYEKSLINKVVTKGLDENVEFKTSEIEWIGKIPKHWEVKKLKYLFEFRRGLTITRANLKDKGIPCINYGEIHSKYGFEFNPNINNLKCVDENYLETGKFSLLNYGDFVFADTSEDIKGVGNFSYLNSKVKTFAGYHTIIISLKIKNNFRFIAYLFNSDSFRNQIREKVKGIKVFSITNSILKENLLLIPPIKEQEQIANYLDKQTQNIQKLIKNKEKQVELYQELRKSVINDAVTGKIKVF